MSTTSYACSLCRVTRDSITRASPRFRDARASPKRGYEEGFHSRGGILLHSISYYLSHFFSPSTYLLLPPTSSYYILMSYFLLDLLPPLPQAAQSRRVEAPGLQTDHRGLDCQRRLVLPPAPTSTSAAPSPRTSTEAQPSQRRNFTWWRRSLISRATWPCLTRWNGLLLLLILHLLHLPGC